MLRFCRYLILFGASCPIAAVAQLPAEVNSELRQLVAQYRDDPRGPYQGIRWFCADGSIQPAQQPCGAPGGVQHGLHRERVQRLAQEQHLFLGQILAGQSFDQFWDAEHQQSRLKQYQLERFLQRSDDGWIMHKARQYRGAVQGEDEDRWGLAFFRELLADDERLQAHYFLIRQAAKDIPHLGTKGNRWENIRSVSKTMAERMRSFEPLRVKLHGQPAAEDLIKVRQFRRDYAQRIDAEMGRLFDTLETDLEQAFREATLSSLARYVPLIPPDVPLREPLQALSSAEKAPVAQVAAELADVMWTLREHLLTNPKGANRLTLIDLSLELESLLFARAASWRASSIGELTRKHYVYAKAAAAAGFLERWEWLEVEPLLRPPAADAKLPTAQFALRAETARRVVEWAAGMVRADYAPVVNLYAGFEPHALEFIDDRIRGSVLLPLGETAGEISELAASASGIRNRALDLKEQSHLRGLNPGFAFGELVVIAGTPEGLDYSPQKIYVIEHPPADLKPVAGILTVSAGNMVSHVQLLARNLGIPNATLSVENLQQLRAYHGRKVFYAVSPKGAVLMTADDQLSAEQRALVSEAARPQSKIKVPIDRLDFGAKVMAMSKLRAADSGRICGPKAANLGQLKSMFPERVGEGLVIPFGVFKRNLDQPMPGSEGSYWEHLQAIFTRAKAQRDQGADEDAVDTQVLAELTEFRAAVAQIRFLPEFQAELETQFRQAFGTELGQLPVFIRSDTNMEDLADFTGAGLNLTVFNVRDRSAILQGIRDVWGSPYTERSYRWRQRYLLNPENVYPSILLLPTVNVQTSGVMITAGVATGASDDITVAFSRGAGGAVEGQAAETWLLSADGGRRLLSPSREPRFNVLPATGGSGHGYTRFHRRVVSDEQLDQLRAAAVEVRQRLPGTPGVDTDGPFDVELGFFEEQIKLFQVRPFVENKRAKSSQFLRGLDATATAQSTVAMDQEL